MNADSSSKSSAAPAGSSSRSLLLFSSLGVLIVAAILFAINYLTHISNAQADFTENKVHTLSEGTKEVLKELKISDAPVTVKLFVSPDDDIPNGASQWLVLLRELRSRLEVFKDYAGNNLKIEVRRPVADSDDEDSAKQVGVNPQQMPNGEGVYFGLAATCLDKTSVIPFIPAIDAPLMEYKLIRAISRVVPNSRKTVGLMTPLEITGGMAMMGGPPPSYFYKELSEDYDVVPVPVTSNEIKTDEYTEYTLDYTKGEFTRQEYKNGAAGTKGSGAFTVQGAEDPKNGGKAPEKLEHGVYRLSEGGTMSDLTFATTSTGSQLSNGKTEGFAYGYTKADEAKATVKVSRGIDVLVVLHPAGISDEAQWAIDQFILKGGKVVALLDSYNITAAESARQQQNPMMPQRGGGISPSSDLQKLVSFWGYNYEAKQAVADINLATPQYGNNPLIITPPSNGINKQNIATQGLNDFVFAFSGGFTGKAGYGLHEEILIETSKDNQLISTDNLNQNVIKNLKNKFVSSEQKRMLAIKLTGKFPTAFPQGKPDAPPPAPPQGGGGGFPGGGFPGGGFPGGPQGDEGAAGPEGQAGTPAVEAPPAAPAPEAPPALTPLPPAANLATPPAPAEPAKPKVPFLTTGEKESTVYLIADADLVSDQVSLEQNRGGLGEPSNSNIPFVLNVIDDLAGNSGLIKARSRTSTARPFTKLNEILNETNKELEKEQRDVDAKIAQWKSDITAAGSKKNPNSPFIMIDQRQLDELNGKVAEGEAKKRELRKKFRKNIDNKFMTYQAWNILGVPVLIIIIGLIVVFINKRQTAAR